MMIKNAQARRLFRSRTNFVLIGLINPAALIAYLILALIIPRAPEATMS